MKSLIIILYLTSTYIFAKSASPPLGLYQFTKELKVDQCAVFNNIGACLKRILTLYKPGDYIESHDSYFNSESNEWDIGFQINGQNKSASTAVLKYIGKADCKGLQKKYQTDLRILDYSCKVDTDCKVVGLKYNSCGGPFGISKSISKLTINKLIKKRKKVRDTCKYIHPPCPAIPTEAYCNNGLCSERSPKSSIDNP